MKKTIIIGSDDAVFSSELGKALEAAGDRVLIVEKYNELPGKISSESPDLVIVAFNSETNSNLCKKIKSLTKKSALIMAGNEKESKHNIIECLGTGVDDYVIRPVDVDIFAAKIGAIMRRAAIRREPDEVTKHGNLNINLTSREVFIGKRKIALTSKETMLLYLLVSRKGTVLTRETLMQFVWEQEYHGDPRTINKHIETLRSKIGSLSESIETVQGIGYRFRK